jgi:hypothetical protein
MVTNNSAILGVVVERAGEIADWHDERLLDEIGIERDARHFVEAGQPLPLIDDEGQRLPKPRVRLDELGAYLLLAHLLQLLHQGL